MSSLIINLLLCLWLYIIICLLLLWLWLYIVCLLLLLLWLYIFVCLLLLLFNLSICIIGLSKIKKKNWFDFILFYHSLKSGSEADFRRCFEKLRGAAIYGGTIHYLILLRARVRWGRKISKYIFFLLKICSFLHNVIPQFDIHGQSRDMLKTINTQSFSFSKFLTGYLLFLFFPPFRG